MIEIAGKKFAENKEELTSECVGYAKRYKSFVKLFDLNNTFVGVINRYGLLCKASLLDNGKWWYNFGTISIIGEPDLNTLRNSVDAMSVSRVFGKNGFTYQFK